jgi:hypothetical protein
MPVEARIGDDRPVGSFFYRLAVEHCRRPLAGRRVWERAFAFYRVRKSRIEGRIEDGYLACGAWAEIDDALAARYPYDPPASA